MHEKEFSQNFDCLLEDGGKKRSKSAVEWNTKQIIPGLLVEGLKR